MHGQIKKCMSVSAKDAAPLHCDWRAFCWDPLLSCLHILLWSGKQHSISFCLWRCFYLFVCLLLRRCRKKRLKAFFQQRKKSYFCCDIYAADGGCHRLKKKQRWGRVIVPAAHWSLFLSFLVLATDGEFTMKFFFWLQGAGSKNTHFALG